MSRLSLLGRSEQEFIFMSISGPPTSTENYWGGDYLRPTGVIHTAKRIRFHNCKSSKDSQKRRCKISNPAVTKIYFRSHSEIKTQMASQRSFPIPGGLSPAVLQTKSVSLLTFQLVILKKRDYVLKTCKAQTSVGANGHFNLVRVIRRPTANISIICCFKCLG